MLTSTALVLPTLHCVPCLPFHLVGAANVRCFQNVLFAYTAISQGFTIVMQAGVTTASLQSQVVPTQRTPGFHFDPSRAPIPAV